MLVQKSPYPVWPLVFEQRFGHLQVMQRLIACARDEVERCNLASGGQRIGNPRLDLLQVGSFAVTQRVHVFVEEALVCKVAIKFEHVVFDGGEATGGHFRKQPPPDCSQQPLEFKIMHHPGAHHRKQQSFRCNGSRAFRAQQFAKTQLARPGIRQPF